MHLDPRIAEAPNSAAHDQPNRGFAGRPLVIEKPLISVVVLTRDRCELLRRALQAIENQGVSEIEIIVVDNGSLDGTVDMVSAEFERVRLILMNRNAGIAARNEGFRIARADTVVSIDDDIELLDPTTFSEILTRFHSDPSLGALSMLITEDRASQSAASAHWWHPRSAATHQSREFDTDHFSEAAVAFRAEALRAAGYYFEELFFGAEEWDLALGLLDAGYRIRFLPIPVLHGAPRGKIQSIPTPHHSNLIRNRCWIALRRLPVGKALQFCLPRLAVWALRAARHGYLRYYVVGIWDLVVALPRIFSTRRPVSRATVARLELIQSGSNLGVRPSQESRRLTQASSVPLARR